jgi:hypothetical protein
VSQACTCSQGQWVHHHAFGGIFRCQGDRDCIQCQPVERKANGRDDLETRKHPQGRCGDPNCGSGGLAGW